MVSGNREKRSQNRANPMTGDLVRDRGRPRAEQTAEEDKPRGRNGPLGRQPQRTNQGNLGAGTSAMRRQTGAADGDNWWRGGPRSATPKRGRRHTAGRPAPRRPTSGTTSRTVKDTKEFSLSRNDRPDPTIDKPRECPGDGNAEGAAAKANEQTRSTVDPLGSSP
jgi:hypothetical protein